MDLVERVLSDHGTKSPLKSRHDEERLSTSTVMVASHPDNDNHTSAREFIPRSLPDSSPIIGNFSAPTVPLYPEPRIDEALFETEDGIGIPLSTACPVFHPAQGTSPYYSYMPSSFSPMYFQEPPPNPKPT